MTAGACLSGRALHTNENYDLLIGAARSSLACSVTPSCIMTAGACFSGKAFLTNVNYNLFIGPARSALACSLASRHIMTDVAYISGRALHTNENYDLLLGAARSSLACSVTSSCIMTAGACLSGKAFQTNVNYNHSLTPHVVDSLAVSPPGASWMPVSIFPAGHSTQTRTNLLIGAARSSLAYNKVPCWVATSRLPQRLDALGGCGAGCRCGAGLPPAALSSLRLRLR